jgi:hypothetical protein
MKHYLYFPTEEGAKAVGELLRDRGYEVHIRKSAADENWLLLATSCMPETKEQMNDLRNEMEDLAAKFDGEYDGWEAPAVSLGLRNGKLISWIRKLGRTN